MKKTLTLLLLLAATSIFAQLTKPPFTPGVERVKSLDEREAFRENSLLAKVPFKSIGPSVFGGRVADVEVSPNDPTHFYVGYASGGLWKTENNGQSFTPIFDQEMVMTIGDIAVDWQRNTIWVGSGEVNSSRSSYAGIGLFRSKDGGETWEHRGLPESHHIGRVIIHPTDPNTLWVAVLGHLYSPNQERGVYKTTDGGATWNRVLFVDGNTGAVDLLLDPQNPNTLYAATWERERHAWDFVGDGPGSAIYRSVDAGSNWTKITDGKNGFPAGDGTGRIGLAAAVQEGQTVLFAVHDNQNRRPKEDEDEEEGLTKDDLREMSREVFLKLKDEELEDFLRENGFPKKYKAKGVKTMVEDNKIEPAALVEYLEDANSQLFDTPVIGAEVYVSTNNGKSWAKTHEGYLDDLYYSYGYYFGQIRVAPQNPDKLYIFGVPVLISEDGGKNWKNINGDNVHVDHHALWVSPDRDGHIILGNDGGINISYDDGENWVKCNTPPVGQFYHVAVDMQDDYHVYGGLQDNGVWEGPHTYEASNRWHNSGKYPYQSIMGGDGMQTAIDSRDNRTVYTGFQFGFYYRVDGVSGKRTRITPRHELGERPLRWNWQTPIHLSNHNQDILYIGAHKLYRSFDQGENWEAISDDLTRGGKPGNVPYGTLTTIHESSLKFGLLYAGSDDGLVHVSKDGGNNWEDISGGLPEDLWVARVQASQHEEGRVYLALNGYRWDDFRPFVYVSENYGESWKRIATDLPLEAVNVVKEDPVNPDVLYVGTDHGLYISLDRGETFQLMDGELPAVAVHDVVVHPRENHLIVGTHGRSIYWTDVQHVQQLTDSILAEPVHVFALAETRFSSRWGNKGYTWAEEVNEPEISIPVYARSAGETFVRIKAEDVTLMTWEESAAKGLNYFEYNGEVASGKISAYEKWLNKDLKDDDEPVKLEKADNEKFYLQPGTYTVEVEKNGVEIQTKLEVKKRL